MDTASQGVIVLPSNRGPVWEPQTGYLISLLEKTLLTFVLDNLNKHSAGQCLNITGAAPSL